MFFGAVSMIMLAEISVDVCRFRIAIASKGNDLDQKVCGSRSCDRGRHLTSTISV